MATKITSLADIFKGGGVWVANNKDGDPYLNLVTIELEPGTYEFEVEEGNKTRLVGFINSYKTEEDNRPDFNLRLKQAKTGDGEKE